MPRFENERHEAKEYSCF